MRGFLFTALVLATAVVAGLTRSVPLTALCFAEVLAAVVSPALVWRFRRKLTASFVRKSGTALRGERTRCEVEVRNTSCLPVSRCAFRLRVRYASQGRFTARWLSGSCEEKSGRLEFDVTPPCCGLMTLWLDRLRVYGPFALASSWKPQWEQRRLAVLPPERPMRLELRGPGTDAGSLAASRKGDPSGSLFEVREALPGEPSRRVHWKLSARTDKLWLREPDREAGRSVRLALDRSDLRKRSVRELDAFYTLLAALTLGLLEHYAAVLVCWTGPETAERPVESAEGLWELLPVLYEADRSALEARSERLSPPPESGEHRLDLTLRWSFDGVPVRQFRPKTLERELFGSVFIL